MSERNETVVRMLAADAPMARDVHFEIAVMARIEQRRFHRGLALNFALALASVILLALVMPGIQGFWQAHLAASFSNGAIAAMLFAAIMPLPWWLARRV